MGRPVRKPVFNEKDEYADIADQIDREAHAAIVPIFTKWANENGYSPRQIFTIVTGAAFDAMSMEMLFNYKKREEK